MREVDDEVVGDVFSQGDQPLSYVKAVSKVPIFEYAIVCEVSVTEEKKTGRGAKLTLKITKQQYNKVSKHMAETRKRALSLLINYSEAPRGGEGVL